MTKMPLASSPTSCRHVWITPEADGGGEKAPTNSSLRAKMDTRARKIRPNP